MIQIWQVPSECGPSNLVVLDLGQVPILKKNQLGSADIVGTIEFLFALKEMPNNNQVSNILPTHSTASAFSPVKQVNNSRSKYLFYDCWL